MASMTERYVQETMELYENNPRPRFEDAHIAHLLSTVLDLETLQFCVANGNDLRMALRYSPESLPQAVHELLNIVKVVLTPIPDKRIANPRDVVALFMSEMGYLQQEEMRVAYLDNKNHLQKIRQVFRGDVSGLNVRVPEVFRYAVMLNSVSIILCHNHPSGVVEPSPEDILITSEIVQAGKILEIKVHDHVIVGQGNWVSLRERGLGFMT